MPNFVVNGLLGNIFQPFSYAGLNMLIYKQLNNTGMINCIVVNDCIVFTDLRGKKHTL